MTMIDLHVRGLRKRQFTQLATKAKRLGMTPERYVKSLVEQDLALDRRASTTRLADLVGPGRDVDETELDRLVEAARTRHHERTRRKR